MRKLLTVLMGLGMFLAGALPSGHSAGCSALSKLQVPGNCYVVHAQAATQAEVDLYPADPSGFPTISTFMDAFDVSGRFVSGLKPQQVTVLEDGQPAQVQALTEMVVPLQLAVAINPSPGFGIHDKRGATPFEGIAQALSMWAKALPADTPDDMSLVSISGPVIAHASARDWLVSLGAFPTDFHATTPNLLSLQIAIETVAVQAPRVGMKRAVLFITPHMDDSNLDAMLQPLIDLAKRDRVRVFVWFVDTGLYTASPSAASFNTLATGTQGAYFSASDTQPSPDLDSYFAPLRRLYALKYESPARTGGSHAFNVVVQGQAGTVKSGEQTFTVDLQPPNAILVSPPLQIVRGPPADDPYNTKILLPTTQQISIIVEFPDGHTRSLVRTTLYVDGNVVADDKAPPFDSFTWDLSSYNETGEHKISVEAVDAFNLSKSSMEIPVTVTVIHVPQGLSAIFARYQQDITAGAVGLAGLILLLVLFMSRFRALFARRRATREVLADPLTQPISASKDATAVVRQKTGKRPRAGATGANAKPAEAAAFLRRMQADPLAAPGQTLKPAPGSTIPLAGREITFGTDPVQSSYVMDDPSLAARHARISQNEAGDYYIVDAGTVAGTWVNFEPVGQAPRLLQHGDVLHFGQLVFRFELRQPPPVVQPRVDKEDPKA